MQNQKSPSKLAGGTQAPTHDTHSPDSLCTVLMLAGHVAPLREMLILANNLKATQRYRCIVATLWRCDAQWIDRINEQGHRAFRTAGAPEVPQKSADKVSHEPSRRQRSSVRFKLLKDIVSFLVGSLLLDIPVKFHKWLREFRKAVRQAAQILDETEPDLVIVGGERIVGLETALLAAANRREIPSLMIPWAISERSGVALTRRQDINWRYRYGMKRWINRQVAKRYPQFVTYDKGDRLLYLTAEALLAAQRLGVMPPQPWQSHGIAGLATHIAVDGERVFDEAVAEGVAPERLSITGRASGDLLYSNCIQAQRQRLHVCTRLGIDANKRIIVCAVPQLAEHGTRSWCEHNREIDFLFQSLTASEDVAVILSLHPKSRLEDYITAAQRFGAVVAGEYRIEELIPICDLFACAASSTVVMAIACRKPIVLLDYILNMSYELFERCPGVRAVTRGDQLPKQIHEILASRRVYQELVRQIESEGGRWLLHDGCSCARLVALVDQFASRGVLSRQKRKFTLAG